MITEAFSVARPLAPEDVRPGMFVMTLKVIEEYHCVHCVENAVKTTRFARTPEKPKAPSRVAAVALPFAFLESATGKAELVDLRRVRLAGVPESFARAVREARSAKASRKSKE